jgi:PAS domain S-box-containing protein
MVITDFLRGAQKAVINTIKVPVLDKNGRVVGLFGIFWDITEQKRTQDALKESERKVRAVFDQTFQFMGLMTTEGDLIEANMAALEFAGVKKSDVINKPFWKTPWWAHSPELQEKLKEAIKVVAEGEFVRFDATHTAKDGSLHEVDFSLKPVKDETGKVILIVPEGRDVTERNRAERELRESEKKFRSIFESMTDGMVLTDVGSHKFYMCNRSFSTMLGYSPEEISSLSIEDIHQKQDIQYVIDQFNALAKGDISIARDIPVKRKDGSIFYTDINVADSLIIVHDKPYLVGFFRDITKQKEVEAEREKTLKWQKDVDALQQLLLAPASLQDKLKTITDGITLIFGIDFCRIWLIRPGDICEKGCIHANVKEGPHVCRYRDKCLHLMASSGRYTSIDGGHARVPFGCYKIGLVASGAEHKFLTNDVVNDQKVHDHEWARGLGLVSFAGYQIKASEAQTIGVLALFAKHSILPAEDAILDSIGTSIAFVVEQAIAEEEKVRLLGLKASTEIKSKFTSTVSHELRSPMAVIKESINLVLEGLVGDVNTEQKDILNTAKNNIDRLGRLINNVLDFQKIEAGKMDLDIKEYDLNEIVLATSKEMNILAENKGLSFEVNIDESIAKINFDKDRIVQVLTNLLSNAIKFTEKGGISVSTERQDNTAHISVKDTGLGMPPGDIPKLFQAFEQLSAGIGKKRGGTGLGLAISKEIILAHNGKIWAESQLGEGTTFHFTLPIKERRG